MVINSFIPREKRKWSKYTVKVDLLVLYIPLQVTPSPKKPDIHWHVNDPGVLVHVANVSWQLSVPSVHSFMSMKAIRKYVIYHIRLMQIETISSGKKLFEVKSRFRVFSLHNPIINIQQRTSIYEYAFYKFNDIWKFYVQCKA